jgi:3-hydroxy-9,10-secoandrosta-1,3,5(10)-triene-9,17-dione monooxygenase
MALDRSELIGRARELAPVFAARALDEEAARAPLDSTVRDMVDSGILATLTPKRYGGHELGVDVMAAITRIWSEACPSTGWVAAFYMGAAWRAQMFGEQAQREIFADKPHMLCAGQAAPLREVLRVPGGYRISGQTPWSSGSVHAEWITFVGVLIEEGTPPAPLMFMVPRAETELVDTWFVAGMRGTGSNDMRVEDVFVPEYRTTSFALAMSGQTPGQALHGNPMYCKPFLPFAMTEVVPVLVGAMRGAANGFLRRTQERQGTISGVKAAGKPATQMRLARAIACADAAETLLDTYLDLFMADRPEQTDLFDRSTMKLKAAFISDLCRNGINDIARGIGGDGFRDASPLQRYFRDVNMLAVHAFLDIDTAAESYGRMTLGLPPEDVLL